MSAELTFRATVELGGKTATGIEVPASVVESLGSSRRPAVQATVGHHTYPTTVASMGGRFLIPLSAANRTAAGVAAGDEVTVELRLSTAPRTVTPPEDLARALTAEPAAQEFWATLAHTHRKEFLRWIEDTKNPQTRATRVTRTVDALAEGRRTR